LFPHQLPYSILGAGLLWVGWFGFNAGSALAAGQLATSAFIVTNTSAAVGLLVWMLIEYLRFGKVTLLGAASGAIAGLAAITPAAGFVNVVSAMLIGFGAALVSYAAISYIKPRLGYDDALDVFGIHGFSGIWGVFAVGLFASPFINAAGTGLLYGNPHQLAVQALGIAVTFAYSFVVTLVIAKSIDLTIGLRVSSDDESQGLDLATHDEIAYRI
jgi:ammonium transporter, Amt family